MKRYFITGTDTDCGKTYITSKLLKYFSSSAAIKPIASGCYLQDNRLVNDDALLLQNNNCLTLDQINPWRFRAPIAPHIAAKKEGRDITVFELGNYCKDIEIPENNTLFIEGAGGLMVPLNEEETWIDFLHYTQIPVLLVVGITLGCINHALLSAHALASEKIECIGWIANCLDPEMLELEENITSLKYLLPFPCLTTIPYAGEIIAMDSL